LGSLTGTQIQAARTLLRWPARRLSELVGLPAKVILDAEHAKDAAILDTFADQLIRDAFEAAGVEFTNGGEPGVRLRSLL
jgi:hypothetical protein